MLVTMRISLYRHLFPLSFGVVLSQIYSTIFFIAPIFFIRRCPYSWNGFFSYYIFCYFSIYSKKNISSERFVFSLCLYLTFVITLTFTPLASSGLLSRESLDSSIRLAILGSVLFFSIFASVPQSIMQRVYWCHILLITAVTILTYGLMLSMGIENFIAWSDNLMISITGRDDTLWNASLDTSLGESFLRLSPPGLNANNVGYSGVLGIILASSLVRGGSYSGKHCIFAILPGDIISTSIRNIF